MGDARAGLLPLFGNFAQVTVESQKLHIQNYFARFSKQCLRMRGNRAKLRPSIDEWKMEAARTALFANLLLQKKHGENPSDEEVSSAIIQFRDGCPGLT